jgi:hypothetical protein
VVVPVSVCRVSGAAIRPFQHEVQNSKPLQMAQKYDFGCAGSFQCTYNRYVCRLLPLQ